jgi:lipopolysaccharide/colanic/teichoic acid biosynthesis glycosyltransferase
MEKIKRTFDIFFSLVGLIFLSPLLILISIFIKVDTSGPILFKQTRIGKDFKPFNIYKFRTMVVDASSKGLPLTPKDDPRITRFGKVLRRTKIDELPQLINVLKGDMSFVGPRPEVPKYVKMFKAQFNEILKIKLGITDYATIEFRNEEEILRKYRDPEEGYIKEVLPIKIELYKKYIKDKGLLIEEASPIS